MFGKRDTKQPRQPANRQMPAPHKCNQGGETTVWRSGKRVNIRVCTGCGAHRG